LTGFFMRVEHPLAWWDWMKRLDFPKKGFHLSQVGHGYVNGDAVLLSRDEVSIPCVLNEEARL
jgi:hypothetical protein